MENNSEMPKSNLVGEMIKKAYIMAKNNQSSTLYKMPAINRSGISDQEYQQNYQESCDYLGPDFLSEKLLKEKLAELKANQLQIRKFLPDQFTIAIEVLPATELGRDLSEAEIKAGTYLSTVLIDPKGNVYTHFSATPIDLYSLIPTEIKDLVSFKLQYSQPAALTATPEEFQKIYQFYIQAFNAWRKYFGLEPLDPQKL